MTTTASPCTSISNRLQQPVLCHHKWTDLETDTVQSPALDKKVYIVATEPAVSFNKKVITFEVPDQLDYK